MSTPGLSSNTIEFLLLYLLLAFLLLVFAYFVFMRIGRGDYLKKGRLTWFSSFLQLLVFLGVLLFPYLYNPPMWAYFWDLSRASSYLLAVAGLILIVLGFIVALGSMAWFGLGRVFGLKVDVLAYSGPYRISRNPQILGFYLLVIGVALQNPSWYAAGWVVLCGIICHWMILSEEEFLRAKFGAQYESYCARTPRYLGNVSRLWERLKQ